MASGDELWIELPPIAPRARRRLIVLLHDGGSNHERFAPVGVAWQLKFPGALGVLLAAPVAGAGARRYWFADRPLEGREDRIADAVAAFRRRLADLQSTRGHAPADTMLVGFGQGATVALESLRGGAPAAAIAVAYAARLARPIGPGESVDATIHLVHGTHDSRVPLVHGERAQRALAAAGARCTLDILADGGHTIDQDMVNLGTARAMQSVFRGRRRAPPRPPRLH